MHDAQPLPVDRQRPRIALRQADQQALLAIAYGGLLSDARSAGALLFEVSRADIVSDAEPSMTISLGSRVLFRDDRAASPQWITLVHPRLARADVGEVSVLTPLGAALIGLSKGQNIRCPDRHGGELSLTVMEVSPPSKALERRLEPK